jgi:predicted acyltransferase
MNGVYGQFGQKGRLDAPARPGREFSVRLISLDVLRGWAVFGMILVNSAAGMKWGAQAAVFPLLLHVPWSGLTFADLVFPAFLMMVGVAIPFSLRGASSDARGRAIVWRTARLVLAGFLLSNLYWFQDFASGEWRLFGVLQRIGIVYGLCAILFLATGARTRLVIVGAVLILYWPLVLLPAGDGLVTDIHLRGHNFAAYVDRLLLGPHLYVQGAEGYDPEGILGTLPAVAHGLIGVAIGELLAR